MQANSRSLCREEKKRKGRKKKPSQREQCSQHGAGSAGGSCVYVRLTQRKLGRTAKNNPDRVISPARSGRRAGGDGATGWTSALVALVLLAAWLDSAWPAENPCQSETTGGRMSPGTWTQEGRLRHVAAFKTFLLSQGWSGLKKNKTQHFRNEQIPIKGRAVLPRNVSNFYFKKYFFSLKECICWKGSIYFVPSIAGISVHHIFPHPLFFFFSVSLCFKNPKKLKNF